MKKILFSLIVIVTVCGLLQLVSVAEASDVNSKEIVKQQTLQDGVTIAVHHRPNDLKICRPNPDRYVNIVLQYAVEAYNEIVYTQGFDTPGFTFANPDRDYCYDRDKTIDIYIGDFSDAPCYDIVKGKGPAYDAVILFPSNYQGYLTEWDAKDFSEQKIAEKIKGTLFHEMFHLISYSYNKNIGRWYTRHNGVSLALGGDWYVEGLARYFETIACSYDNFFSKGFIKKEAGKIIRSQDGANYLIENPSESLKKARYDYSLFWAYLHKRYGMDKIEEISRRFRFITKRGLEREAPAIISAALKEEFEDVLHGFAVAMYFKDFKTDINTGINDIKAMSLDDFSKKGYRKIASWANNFIKLNLDNTDIPAVMSLKKVKEKGELKISVVARLQDGRRKLLRKLSLKEPDIICNMNLADMKQGGVKELILIITNTSPDFNTAYKIFQS